MEAINAKCIECGATFPRSEATTDVQNVLSCPVCGSSIVRGIPARPQCERVTTRCGACGATFPRSEATTDVKGELACPVCGSRTDLESLDDRRDTCSH
ncbi:hypothetical protein ACFOZ7_17005 [Natribaculum luteum]|uniref:Zinc ribbon domain-containing protein n=1 Tax=Natribaculum luteum TaxID=1586232 RepID=A0ABD5P2R7_9EURY|nr:hypothetical protein [Natribaculum luteum]